MGGRESCGSRQLYRDVGCWRHLWHGHDGKGSKFLLDGIERNSNRGLWGGGGVVKFIVLTVIVCGLFSSSSRSSTSDKVMPMARLYDGGLVHGILGEDGWFRSGSMASCWSSWLSDGVRMDGRWWSVDGFVVFAFPSAWVCSANTQYKLTTKVNKL